MENKFHREAKVARSTKRKNFHHDTKKFPPRSGKISITMPRKLRRHEFFPRSIGNAIGNAIVLRIKRFAQQLAVCSGTSVKPAYDILLSFYKRSIFINRVS